MTYREKVVKLDRENDAISITWDDVTYDGDVDMAVSVYRVLKNGTHEDTRYTVRLSPEEALCAISTLKRAVRGGIVKMEERIVSLEKGL